MRLGLPQPRLSASARDLDLQHIAAYRAPRGRHQGAQFDAHRSAKAMLGLSPVVGPEGPMVGLWDHLAGLGATIVTEAASSQTESRIAERAGTPYP
jgi:hypothetical protein